MSEKYMKTMENKRGREDARRAGRRRGQHFAWRVLNLVMALTMLLNSVSFAVPANGKAIALRAEANVGTDSVDFHVGESETDLGGDSISHDGVQPENTYAYAFGEEKTVMLSAIFAMYQLPVSMWDVDTVLVLGSDALTQDTAQVHVAPLMDENQQIYDYEITALQFFGEVRLSVNLKNDAYTLVLVNLPAELQNADLSDAGAFEVHADTYDESYETYEADLDDEDSQNGDEIGLDYVFDLRGTGKILLSEIANACDMSLTLDEVEMVGTPGGSEEASVPVSVEQTDSDYEIIVMDAFDETRLTVYTADDMYTVALLNGAPAEDEAELEPTDDANGTDDAEPTAEPPYEDDIEPENTPETVEEPTEQVEEQPTEQTEVDIDENSTDDVENGQTEVGSVNNGKNDADVPDESGDGAPEITVEQPETTGVQPEATDEQPEATDEQTETTDKQPEVSDEQSVATEEQPEAQPDPAQITFDESTGYEGTYLMIAPVGEDVALRRIEIEAADYLLIEEAYTFESGTGAEVALGRMPELDEGEYLALYGIRDGMLSDSPVADHWIEGDGAAVSAVAWQGFALARLGLTDYQQLDAESVGDTTVEVSGTLPVSGSVSLERVAEIEAEDDVLATCEISILDAADNAFEPLEGQPIEVTLRSEAIRAANEAGSALSVVQVAEGFETDAGVEIVSAEADAVTFTTESCDAFAVREKVLEKTLDASDEKTYKITVSYDTASGIPTDAELVVSEIVETDEEYAEYVKQSVDKLGVEDARVFARAFDIAFVNPETGEEYHPEKDVKVSIELLDDSLNEYDTVDVVHFPGEDEQNPDVMDASLEGEAVEFATGSFSVYVLVYTVDFHWGDYTYSIAGESEILLSELLEKLGVTEITIADVEDVTFSDESLVRVEERDGDWLLTSLAPFTTEEVLTLTFKNGQSVEIKVTDAAEVAFGDCGTNTKWVLTDDGVLTISLTEGATEGTVTSFAKTWMDSAKLETITKVIVEDGITSMPTPNNFDSGMFMGLTNVKEIQFPSTLKSIPKCACKNLTNLTTVNFSELTALESINNDAFNGCTALISPLNLSGSPNLTTIMAAAFKGCSALPSVDLSQNGKFNFQSGNNQVFMNCSGLTEVKLPATITIIPSYQFSECSNLEKVNFENLTALVEIGTYAFNKCTKLKNADFSKLSSLKTIGQSAFEYCSAFDAAIKSSEMTSLTSIGAYAFNSTSVTEVDLTDVPMTEIKTKTFYNCKKLTKLVLPADIAYIREYAFTGCSSLTDFDLSVYTSLTTIEKEGFRGESAMTGTLDLTGLKDLNTIGGFAFADWKIEKADFSGLTQLTTINGETFTACRQLKEISFSGCTKLTSVASNAFNNCDSLNIVDFSNTGISSIEAVRKNSVQSLNLSGCENIKEVSLNNLNNLTTLYLPSTVTSLTNIPTSLKTIYFDGTLEQWNSITKGTMTGVDVHLKVEPLTVTHDPEKWPKDVQYVELTLRQTTDGTNYVPVKDSAGSDRIVRLEKGDTPISIPIRGVDSDGNALSYKIEVKAVYVNGAVFEGYRNAVEHTEGLNYVVNILDVNKNISVEAAWRVNDVQTWPEGVKKVVMGLYTVSDGDKTAYQKDGSDYTIELTSADSKVNFEKVPTTYSDDQEIVYLVKVERIYAGNGTDVTANYITDVEEKSMDSWVVTLTRSISVDIQKVWYGTEEDNFISVDLYRTTVDLDAAYSRAELSQKLADTNAELLQSGLTLSKGAWDKTVSDLKDRDADGKPYYYYAIETNTVGYAERYTIAPATETANRKLTITNTDPVCWIQEDGLLFASLADAVRYANDYYKDAAVIIRVLKDTVETEAMVIDADSDITVMTDTKVLNTAATVKRGFNNDSLVTVKGNLTLQNIVLDGDKENHTGSLALIDGGALTVADATLQNAKSDTGAVYVTDATGRVNLSGAAVIYGNTKENGDPANVYLAVPDPDIINTIGTGLTDKAKIGVRCEHEGFNAPNATFAAASNKGGNNTDRFINDIKGYKGKTVDTSRIIWGGFSLTLVKKVAEAGSRSADIFTLTVTSDALTEGTYDITGAPANDVTVAEHTITIKNVTADQAITIDGLTEGSFTVAEADCDYVPAYEVKTVEGENEVANTNGTFTMNGGVIVTVTNTRKSTTFTLAHALNDLFKLNNETVNYTVKLAEIDGAAIANYPMAEGITTDESGAVTFNMGLDTASRTFTVPQGAVVTITPTIDKTLYDTTITPDEYVDGDTIIFNAGTDGITANFAYARKKAEVVVSKSLAKSLTANAEFIYEATLTYGEDVVKGFTMADDITTDDSGKATFKLKPANNGTTSVTLTLPVGTTLAVTEQEVTETVGEETEVSVYDTTVKVNDTAVALDAAQIANITSNGMIAFASVRKTKTVTVSKTVVGYAGTVETQTFDFTATLKDAAGKKLSRYTDDDFEEGAQTFALGNNGKRELTVPIGATVTVEEKPNTDYKTLVKLDDGTEAEKRDETFDVTNENRTLAFTNRQLVMLVLDNQTAADMDVTVKLQKAVRVFRSGTPEDLPQDKQTTVAVKAGETVRLGFDDWNSTNDKKETYTVSGVGRKDYYLTVTNASAFNEDAVPDRMQVFGEMAFSVQGQLRYSATDSIVTFTEQPLVEFDVNGGGWTTELQDEGYHRITDDGKTIYQLPKDGDTVGTPTKPVYSGMTFGGWTKNSAVLGQTYTEAELDAANIEPYDFKTAPTRVYAIWIAPTATVRFNAVKGALATEAIPEGYAFESLDGNNTYVGSMRAGAVLAKPASDPVMEGAYRFIGWTTDKSLAGAHDFSKKSLAEAKAELYDFTEPVTGDMTLYAVYADTATVVFMNDETEYARVVVVKGETVSEPTAPTKEGVSFLKWTVEHTKKDTTVAYADMSTVTGYDFSAPVTDSLTLYATWVSAESVTVTVTKTVEGATDADAAFTFNYTIDEGENQTFTLRDGEQKEIRLYKNGDATPKLTVSETVIDGYTLKSVTANSGTVENDSYTFTAGADAVDQTVTFTNARQTQTVTIKNDVSSGDDAFSYTARLLENNAAVTNYALGDVSTDAQGNATFTLSGSATKALNIPTGAKLVVTMDTTGFGSYAYSDVYEDGDAVSASFTAESVDKDGTIAFANGVCKITDAEDETLTDANGRPAVYVTLTDAFADYEVLEGAAQVKLLIDDYYIAQREVFVKANTAYKTITFPANKAMTLTTAQADDAVLPYAGVRTRSVINRYPVISTYQDSCFVLPAGGDVTLTNIVLDGGADIDNMGNRIGGTYAGSKYTVNGGLIRMEGGALRVTTGSTLRNSTFENVTSYTDRSFGAAIYVKDGKLTVEAGLFTNCLSRFGGAIYVADPGQLTITGANGSTQFINCHVRGKNGGAIYSASSKPLTIDGGKDKDDCGVIFKDCSTIGDGEGGGVFVLNADCAVTLRGIYAEHCSSIYKSAIYNGGGVFYIQAKSVRLEHSTFYDDSTLGSGATMLAYVFNRYKEADDYDVVVDDCAFNSCDTKRQGAGFAMYPLTGVVNSKWQAVEGSRSKVTNCTFTDCTSGTDNGSAGAIQTYMQQNTIEDCVFTNCWAGKDGGAINHFYAEEGSTDDPNSKMTIRRCTFTNCRAEDRTTIGNNRGGAIASRACEFTVADSTFTDCVTTSKQGGAIFNFYDKLSGSKGEVTNCTFTGCSSRLTGGAIYASSLTGSSTFNVSDCSFENCASTTENGGTIYANKISLDINNTTFTNSSSAKDGGMIYVYGTTTDGVGTEVSVTNSHFTNGAAVQSGGGIFTNSCPTVSVTDSSFTNCSGEQNGGAIYINGKCEATITDVNFTKCSAKQNGGAIKSVSDNSTLTVKHSNFENNKAIGDGGAVYIDKTTTRINFSEGTTFTGNTTEGNGGAMHNKGNNALISDTTFTGNTAVGTGGALNNTGTTPSLTNVTFTRNKAAGNGGAVNNTGTYLTLTNVTFTDNEATGDGGAVNNTNTNPTVTTATFTGNKAGGKGGALCLNKDTTANLTDADFTDNEATGNGGAMWIYNTNITRGKMTGNKANDGSAVYVIGGKTVTIIDVEITGNTAAAAEGGAIATSSKDGKYSFGGDTVVRGNTSSGDVEVEHNAVLAFDINTTIRTTANGLGEASNIGVYVATPNNAYKNHGINGLNFGYYVTGGNVNLNHFVNDKHYDLFGVDAGSGNNIRWSRYVCKITNEDHETLTRADGLPALYESISAAFTDFTTIEGAPVYVEMLVENYAVQQNAAITVPANVNITLTTASTDSVHYYRGAEGTVCTIDKGKNTGSPTFTMQSETSVLTITNITLDGRTINADGTVTPRSVSNNGALIRAEKGTLCVLDGTTFQYGKGTDGSDSTGSGAIWVGSAASATLETHGGRIRFISCEGGHSGGAIHTDNGQLTIEGEETDGGAHRSITFEDCHATRGGAIMANSDTPSIKGAEFIGCYSMNEGGAIYHSNKIFNDATIDDCLFTGCYSKGGGSNSLGGAIASRAQKLTVANSTFKDCYTSYYGGALYMLNDDKYNQTLTLSGNTVINGCSAKQGGAIYLKSGVTLYPTGDPTTNNGATFTDNRVTFANNRATEKGAGIHVAQGAKLYLSGSMYFDANYKESGENFWNGDIYNSPRQDVYIEGYANKTAESVYINGELTGSEIWVWPEQVPHKLTQQQFAKLSYPTVSDVSLMKLRNALSNDETHCARGEHLSGIRIGDDTQNVYWGLMGEVSFAKVDDWDNTVVGATFALYTDSKCENMLYEAVSDEDGEVLFPAVPVGVYYMKELDTPDASVNDGAYYEQNRNTYLVLVGTSGLTYDANSEVWGSGGALDNVNQSAVRFVTLNRGIHQGIFTIKDGRAVVSVNLSEIVNYRVVCKLTTSDNTLLYYMEDGAYWPAIYRTAKQGMETAASGTALYVKNGDSYTLVQGADRTTLKVKMLVTEHEITAAIRVSGDYDITLTTADLDDVDYPYPYEERSTLIRDRAFDASMITSDIKALTVGNITLDGSNRQISANGGLINVASGSLTVNGGASLQNAVTTGNGGAVYLAEGTRMTLTDGEIANNAALNESKGETDYSGGGGVFVGKKATFTMTGGAIHGNRTSASFTGNLDHQPVGGGGVLVADYATMTVTGGEIYENQTAGKGGGILVYGQSNGSVGGTLNIKGSAESFVQIHDNVARYGGGVAAHSRSLYGLGVTLDLSYATVSNNTATNRGGGIYVGIKDAKATIANATITGNTAQGDNGGGLYITSSSTVMVSNTTISDNETPNRGGGFYADVADPAKLVLDTVEVTNNSAEYGGGGCAYRLTLKNTQITGNWTSHANSEGPLIEGAGGLFLKDRSDTGTTPALVIDDSAAGAPTEITGNKTRNESLQTRQVASDLRLPYKDNANDPYSVQLNSLFNGKLEVCNPGDSGTVFGTDAQEAYEDIEDATQWRDAKIVSQNESMLYGRRRDKTVLYWYQDYICKITTGVDGELLHTMDDDGALHDAVYMYLYQFEGNKKNMAAFNVLNDADNKWYLADGSEYDGSTYCVEMLVDYGINTPVVVDTRTEKVVTLTTASKTKKTGDDYIYRESGDTATLDPGSSMGVLNRNGEAFMFRLTEGTNFTLENITLDGGVNYILDDKGNFTLVDGIPSYTPDSFISKRDGFLVQLTSNSSLTVGDGATLQNTFTTHMYGGAAICFGTHGGSSRKLVLKEGSKIIRCCSAYDPDKALTDPNHGGVGGAISVYRSEYSTDQIIIEGGSIDRCWAQEKGGAIYAPNQDRARIFIKGGEITNCIAPAGGGIYLDAKTAISIEGTLKYDGNYGMSYAETLADKKNGIENILNKDGYVRQDIFVNTISGKPAKAITVTGRINASAGSIWIWTNTENSDEHYKDSEQFAVFDSKLLTQDASGQTIVELPLTDAEIAACGGNAQKLQEKQDEVLKSTLRVFHNALDNDTTKFGDTYPYDTYLTGTEGAVVSNIYWGPAMDGFNIVFRKIDGYGDVLDGAKFTLYQADENGDYVEPKVALNADEPAESGKIAVENAVSVKYSLDDGETVNEARVYGEGLVCFESVPVGHYIMTESAPAVTGTTTPYETREYSVEVGNNGLVVFSVRGIDDSGKVALTPAPTTRFTEDSAGLYTLNPETPKAEDPGAVDICTVMNTLPFSRKVILRKVGESYAALSGLKFTLYAIDGTPIAENLESKDSGVFYIGELHYGLYYAREDADTVPSGYAKPADDEYFAFRVSDKGIEQVEKNEDGVYPTTNELRLKNTSGSGGDDHEESTTGNAWGEVTGLKDLRYTDYGYSFVDNGKTIVSKPAYVWDLSYTSDNERNRFYINQDATKSPAGTLLYYNGQFWVAVQDNLDKDIGEQNQITNFAMKLQSSPKIVTADDFKGGNGTLKDNYNVSHNNETIIYSNGGGGYWLCIQDGSPKKPAEDPGRWLYITPMLNVTDTLGGSTPSGEDTPSGGDNPNPSSSGNGYTMTQTSAWDGNKDYAISFTNTSDQKVASVTVTVKVHGTVTSIGGNVSGSVNGDTATITFNNYGNGIEAGANVGPIYMAVTGTGDFSLE